MSLASIPSAPADLELIAQLKSKLQYAELRIRVLEERLRLMRIEKYGAGGEKLSQAQMQLFELEPVVSEMTEQAESEHAPVHRSTKKSVKHPGRQELPANLPRVERVLPCTPDQRVCKRCGKETVVIGSEESSQLDVEPAKYFVLVAKREKRACPSCVELGVVSAPLPPRIIEKCLASDRIVIDTVVSKYCNHTPLHRQSMILERDLGLKISRATLDGWVLKVGELLIPMVAAMRRELITGTYIQADETPVDVQTREGRGKNHQAYLWQYSRPGGTVVFDFRLGRGRDGPKRFLGQFEGILPTGTRDAVYGEMLFSMLCGVTEQDWFDLLSRCNAVGGGLMSRFNIIGTEGEYENVAKMNPPDFTALQNTFLPRIAQLEDAHVNVPPTEAAVRIISEWADNLPEGSERMNIHAWRSALLLAWLRHEGSITAKTSEDAVSLGAYQIASHDYYRTKSADNAVAKVQAKIVRALELKGAMSKRDLQKRTNAYRDGTDLWNRALDGLWRDKAIGKQDDGAYYLAE